MLIQVLKDWAWLQRAQWLKKEQLEEIQGRKLRDVVNHAASKVPFYKRMYESAGVAPSSIKDAGDVQKLPVITKQQIRDTPLKERKIGRAHV